MYSFNSRTGVIMIFTKENLIDKDGFAKKEFTNTPIASDLSPAIQEKIKAFARELILSYPEGTRFLIEKKVINTKEKGMLASTVDFKAIVPVINKEGDHTCAIQNDKYRYIVKTATLTKAK